QVEIGKINLDPGQVFSELIAADLAPTTMQSPPLQLSQGHERDDPNPSHQVRPVERSAGIAFKLVRHNVGINNGARHRKCKAYYLDCRRSLRTAATISSALSSGGQKGAIIIAGSSTG